MNRAQATSDGRPASVPASIAARQRAARRSHLRARLLVLLATLHVVYFLVPLLPFAQTRVGVPLLLWLPPLFAVTVLVCGFLALRRCTHRRRHASQFVPLPPVEEV